MTNLWRTIIFTLLILSGCWSTFGQTTPKTDDIKNKYQNVEIVRFENKDGVTLPAESRDVIMSQIVEELKQLKKFKQVANVGETIPQDAGPTVRLNGTITQYKPGSRAKRYLVGFGAGATKVVAHITFTDVATGAVLFEKDVDGTVWIGVFGGDSSGATRGLAKEVGKVTKKTLF
jgi:uncharacterized protein DUF4410